MAIEYAHGFGQIGPTESVADGFGHGVVLVLAAEAAHAGTDIVIAEVEHAKTDGHLLAGNSGHNARPSNRNGRTSGLLQVRIKQIDVIAVNRVLLAEAVEQRSDRVM